MRPKAKGTIEIKPHATILTGEATRIFSLRALINALKLEQKGLKRRGQSALAIAKKLNGNKNNDREVHILLLQQKINDLLLSCEVLS